MTDTIRSVDKNHLVFVGAQYFAELTDIPYRPGTGGIEPYLRTKYLKAVDQMARACGAYCWNVWPLTFYDFNPYPADDAMTAAPGRRGDPRDGVWLHARHAGREPDPLRRRPDQALRSGIKRPWQDIDGEWHDAQWGLADAIRELDLNGAAPWGSPYPNPNTDLGSDLDRRRGISLAPEGMDALADLDRRRCRPGVPERSRPALRLDCQAVSSSAAARPAPAPARPRSRR